MNTNSKHMSRRQALRLAGLAVSALAVAACGAEPTLTAGTPATATQATSTDVPSFPAIDPTAPIAGGPRPQDAPRNRMPLGAGPSVAITPVGEFYTVSISQGSGWIDASSYFLSVSGAVQQPLSFSLNDLKSLPTVEQMRTLECISNPVGGNLIGNATWKAVRLSDVLSQVRLNSDVVEIRLRAADGFSTSIPVALALDKDSLLAYEMNGQLLTDPHGAPLRALWPGRYGMKQPKWITSIEAITKPYLGYWEQQGWSNEAIIKINSQIRTPDESEEVSAGVYPISGVAYSDHTGVAKVDISTDGGKTWTAARLVRAPSTLAWTEWRFDWQTPASGSHTIIARAADGAGKEQPVGTSRVLLPDNVLEGVSQAHRLVVFVK